VEEPTHIVSPGEVVFEPEKLTELSRRAANAGLPVRGIRR